MPKGKVIKVKLQPNIPAGKNVARNVMPVKKSSPEYLKAKSPKG